MNRHFLFYTEDNLYSVSQLVNPMVLKYLNIDQQDLQDAVKFASMEAQGVLSVMNPRFG